MILGIKSSIMTGQDFTFHNSITTFSNTQKPYSWPIFTRFGRKTGKPAMSVFIIYEARTSRKKLKNLMNYFLCILCMFFLCIQNINYNIEAIKSYGLKQSKNSTSERNKKVKIYTPSQSLPSLPHLIPQHM